MESNEDPYVVLSGIAQSRHCLLQGNQLDTEKAAKLLLDDYRNGKIGKITLEFPADESKETINESK